MLSHCGSRSQLEAFGGSAGPASSGGTGGTGTSPDGGVLPPPEPCVLGIAGPPVEIMAFQDAQVMAPSMVMVDPGSAASGTPANVALQGFISGGPSLAHPDIKLQRLRVGPSWPDDVTVDQAPMAFGVEAHGWGEMAHAPGDTRELALAWYSDPDMDGYTAFRTLDFDSWAATAVVEMAPEGRPALALAPGRGIRSDGAGYGGDGYAIAWRELIDVGVYDTTTKVGVLDLDREVQVGPVAQGVPAPYPGYSPSITWSSETYLIATALPECGPSGDCEPTLTVERLVPDSTAAGGARLELAWSRTSGMVPDRPSLASWRGRTWVAWMESAADHPGHPEVYVQELDPMGKAVGGAHQVDDFIRPESRLSLTASDLGLAIAYARGGLDVEPDEPGNSRVVVIQLDHTGNPLAAMPLLIDATSVNDYGPPRTVALDYPRGLLLTWAGRSFDSGYDIVAYLGFLPCIDP